MGSEKSAVRNVFVVVLRGRALVIVDVQVALGRFVVVGRGVVRAGVQRGVLRDKMGDLPVFPSRAAGHAGFARHALADHRGRRLRPRRVART